MYVRGLTGCARYCPSDAAFGYPVFVPAASSALSRSRSAGHWGAASAADEDLRELVRAASQRRVEQRAAELRAVARSQSMAAALSMARIDEDVPCEFGDGPGGAMGARSQSCVGGDVGRMARRGHRKVVALV
ncbi:unnamed protein product [Urochloa humidicola]